MVQLALMHTAGTFDVQGKLLFICGDAGFRGAKFKDWRPPGRNTRVENGMCFLQIGGTSARL